MEEFVVKDGKKLRLGYTTGSCAAAAAKAAAWMLLTGKPRERISLVTPKGIALDLEVLETHRAEESVRCAVRKDSGDDPDVTKGTLIFAEVSFADAPGVVIDGGVGVGRVTKRGLDQPVGAAAINSVPRAMIRENVEEVCRLADYGGGLSVVISAPEGEALAKKTFNPRLGIEGGISILGTTGIVEPMSEQALVDTIRVELRQKRAGGADHVLLTPGNYGADYIREHIGLDPERAVLTSNYIGDTLEIVRELGFKGALLVGHIGKLVKIAGGMLNTHSKYGDCRMDIMTACAAAEGLRREKAAEMLTCATCDDALRILREEGLFGETLGRIADRIAFILDAKSGGAFETGAVLFSKEYGFLCETKNARSLLDRIKESEG
ncbi:MAG: cobalamin biosynthesis protein CbiD [Oscillospiraceae bacterium]|nr:cobalamin biosynthesis protein CbiD [Oscillospiraceae bacterium]